MQACGFPLYWKGTLFSAAGGDKTGLLSYVAFSDFWRKMCANHHDDAAQLAHILSCKNQTENRKGLLSPEDFVPLVQDVVDTHPGLGFLKEATEFHSRYVHTVSFKKSRFPDIFCFYCFGRICFSGKKCVPIQCQY